MFFRRIAKIPSRPIWVASCFLLLDWLFLSCIYLFWFLSDFGTSRDVFSDVGNLLHSIWWWGHKDLGNRLGYMMFPVMTSHPPRPSVGEFFILEALCTFKFFFLGLVSSVLFKLGVKAYRFFRQPERTQEAREDVKRNNR
jgi:hypothetical protein